MDKDRVIEIRHTVSGESRFHFSYISGFDISYISKIESGVLSPQKPTEKLFLLFEELSQEQPNIDKMKHIMNMRIE